jgi:hypothetical protein
MNAGLTHILALANQAHATHSIAFVLVFSFSQSSITTISYHIQSSLALHCFEIYSLRLLLEFAHNSIQSPYIQIRRLGDSL